MRRVIRLAVLASALFTALPTPAQEAPGAGPDGRVPVGTIVALRRPITEAKDLSAESRRSTGSTSGGVSPAFLTTSCSGKVM
jgi:hypothetical protein